ncbi:MULTISPECIES: 7-cyano-7-deazaguanine synthase [unclassified Bradyrhizobium]|uniref:7-cyano-7-deazaguanine synthase n=1 Tax=unclassified Bradyrhizobium TaxID=2631580 RepID=UPI0028F04B33|nr:MULTISPECIES: 7-cyano-7-deazaguanine synthase [unclassified Bradyrhizobium]
MGALLLCSGGLDSTTVGYWLMERRISFQPVFFDYGQHCVEKEWRTLQEVLPVSDLVPPATRVDISGIFQASKSRLIVEPNLWTDHVEDEDLYVPYRTLLFFSVGACIAQTRGLDIVYSGFINSNHAKELDCSAAFLNGLESLSHNIGAVRFEFPFRDWSKSDVVRHASELRVPIGKTYSCQLFSDIPCGACPNCVERILAIESVNP